MATTHTNRLTAGAIQPVAKPEPAASTALKPIEPGDLNEVMTFAQVAVRSGTFGLKNIEEAAFRILYGRELGMSVFQSIMGIDIIQGRPGLKAGTVASLIQRSGRYEYRVGDWDHTKCVIEFFDGGMVLGKSTFTIDDAKRAGVYKDGSNWSKYPKAMLFARAITQGARAYCPSIFFGPIYSSEELADGGGDVIDVEIATTEPAAAVEPVVEAKPAAPAKKAKAEPKPEVIEATVVEEEKDDFGDRVRRIDEWAERAAKRFEDKGQASFAKPGEVIAEIHQILAEAGTLPHGVKGYRNQVNAIAKISTDWNVVLEHLKSAASFLAASLESPPDETPADESPSTPWEPGSEG